MAQQEPANTITMRAPCACGGEFGVIHERNGQDCVFCATCDRWQYNAPRVETGRKVRNLSSREGITPSMRARIFDRHDHACIKCGRRPPEIRLELGHIISREQAAEYEMLDDLIDSEWNLAPMCPECNSGDRWLRKSSIRLMYRCLQMAERSGM